MDPGVDQPGDAEPCKTDNQATGEPPPATSNAPSERSVISSSSSSISLNLESVEPLCIKVSTCGKCTALVATNDKYLTCSGCNDRFHLKCTKVDKKVYSALKSSSCFDEFLWQCSQCKQDGESYSPSNKKLISLIEALQRRISIIENDLQKHSTKSSGSNDTDHKATATIAKHDNVSHQVLMTPKENEKFTLQSFAEIARKELPTVPIKKLGVTKKGQGFLKLPSKADCDAAVSKLKDSYNITAENVEKRNLLPKITISDINSEQYTNSKKEELKTAILNKNPKIKDCVDNGKEFEVVFIAPDKAKNFSRAVVKIHPDILQIIKQLRYKLYVDFSSCRVSDRFYIKQCYRCQKFGHSSDNCSLKETNKHVCRYCSADHTSTSCSFKGKHNEHHKCANCGGNHSSTYASCPSLQKQVRNTIDRTKGLEDFSKNPVPPHAIVT